MGPTALLPLRRKLAMQTFISFKTPLSSTGFEPTHLGSNGKHANHYTAEGGTCVSYVASNGSMIVAENVVGGCRLILLGTIPTYARTE
jgi:secreted trypsin-like serine protease